MKSGFINEQKFPLVIYPDEQSSFNDLIDLCNQHKDELLHDLSQQGAVLFRGFSVSKAEELAAFSKVFLSSLLDYKGGDSPRSTVSESVYTSTEFPPKYKILAHNEMSYSNAFPRILFFFCSIAPEVGGETPIVDGRVLYKKLDKALIERFKNKKVKYIMNLCNKFGMGRSWQQAFETDDKDKVEEFLKNSSKKYVWKNDGGLKIEEIVDPIIEHPVTKELVFFCQAPQWHPISLDQKTRDAMYSIMSEQDFYHFVCFGDDSLISEDDLNQITALAEQEQVKFPWQQGDILMVDNILSLHAREPFSGPRKILVSMG